MTFLDESFEIAFDIMVPRAPYLMGLPERSTSADGSDGTRLYAPSVEFFEVIVWNVVGALGLFAVARPLFDRYFRGRKAPLLTAELEDARRALARIEAAQRDPAVLYDRIDALMRSDEKREALEFCVGLLERHGWPGDEAARDVEATLATIGRATVKQRAVTRKVVVSHPRILEIHAAAIQVDLVKSRNELLAGLDPVFVAALPTSGDAAGQLLSDLSSLNRTGCLADGTRPLHVWLQNAHHLTGIRVEAEVFRRAILELDAPDRDAGSGFQGARSGSELPPKPPKHIILFLAANPLGTDRTALDREARAIQLELEHSSFRDCFELVTRWAAEPLDLLRELRRLKPTVVHFSGHGAPGAAARHRPGPAPRRDVVIQPGPHDAEPQHGLFFQGPDGRPQLVSTVALEETFSAAGASVQLVVLSACYSDVQARTLLPHVGCVIGMSGAVGDDAARAFAIGFYGGLGDRESIDAAYRQGCAAISLEGLGDRDRPQLAVHAGLDANKLILAAASASVPASP